MEKDLNKEVMCHFCGEHFKLNEVEHKIFNDANGDYEVFQCPNCGQWVTEEGLVHQENR